MSIVFVIFSIVLVCDWECFIDRYPDVQKARWLQNPEYGSNIYQRAEWWWNEKGRKAPRDCSCGNKIHNDIEKSILNVKTFFENSRSIKIFSF